MDVKLTLWVTLIPNVSSSHLESKTFSSTGPIPGYFAAKREGFNTLPQSSVVNQSRTTSLFATVPVFNSGFRFSAARLRKTLRLTRRCFNTRVPVVRTISNALSNPDTKAADQGTSDAKRNEAAVTLNGHRHNGHGAVESKGLGFHGAGQMSPGLRNKTDVIVAHQMADFDALGSAVGLSRLRKAMRQKYLNQPEAEASVRIVLSEHHSIQPFLCLYRSHFELTDLKSVDPETVGWVGLVDCQRLDRLGPTAEFLKIPNVEVSVLDHHVDDVTDVRTSDICIDGVGAAATLVVERLRKFGNDSGVTPFEATAMALGIHADTGSLKFETTTDRDAAALGWLMHQGASKRAINEYLHPPLSQEIQELLAQALEELQLDSHHGYVLGSLVFTMPSYIQGLARLAHLVMDVTGCDVLILGAYAEDHKQLSVIGRASSRFDVDLAAIMRHYKGGGHAKAAAATLKDVEDIQGFLGEILALVRQGIPPPASAADLMSTPVYYVSPSTAMQDAWDYMTANGCKGLCVVDPDSDTLLGVITEREFRNAQRHALHQSPVKGFMHTNFRKVGVSTPIYEIERIFEDKRVNRLPVMAVDGKHAIGVITRSDVLRHLNHFPMSQQLPLGRNSCP